MRIVRYYPRALAGDGGMTGAVCSSARTASRIGSRVSVAYDGSTQREAPVDEERLEWVPLRHRGPRGFRIPIGLDDLLVEADLLVLHSAWTSHNLAAAALARRVGTPYILEPRGAYDPHIVRRHQLTKAFWWRAGEERMVHRSLAVHLFFDSEREHLTRLGYHGATVVSPNGVNIPDGARWDGGSGGYLLWLGRFDPQHKGLDLLLEALELLPPTERPALRLHGPDWRGGKQRIADFVASRGLGDSVTVGAPAYGDEKRELLSRARAFVYPSRWEAFGNSVTEAASMGVPVLTTTYPLGNFLAERSAGIACDPNPKSLADGIRGILDPGAQQLGSRAKDVAAHDFNWERVVRSWLAQAEALL